MGSGRTPDNPGVGQIRNFDFPAGFGWTGFFGFWPVFGWMMYFTSIFFLPWVDDLSDLGFSHYFLRNYLNYLINRYPQIQPSTAAVSLDIIVAVTVAVVRLLPRRHQQPIDRGHHQLLLHVKFPIKKSKAA